jgi:hypothetical protein
MSLSADGPVSGFAITRRLIDGKAQSWHKLKPKTP